MEEQKENIKIKKQVEIRKQNKEISETINRIFREEKEKQNKN